MSKRKQDDDADLEKLLGDGQRQTSMNLDTVVRQSPVSVSPRQKQQQQRQINCVDFMIDYTGMLCHYYPRLCGCLVLFLLITAMTAMALAVLNPTQELGLIHHHVTSKYDLTLGHVDHWCLRGSNSGCACEDPLQPQSRGDHLSWVQGVQKNRSFLQNKLSESNNNNDINIAFVGESIVEAMGGRWMGKERSVGLKQLAVTFKNHFEHSNADDPTVLNGVALGMAGDTAPNVLWRLLHGELPDKLQPKIFWVSLGMNDLSRMQCSEEIVVLGILRVVEELMEKRPRARIVINSMFPIALARGDPYPVLSSFNDAFDNGNNGRERQLLVSEERNLRKKKKKQEGKKWSEMTEAERAEAVEQKRDQEYRKKKKNRLPKKNKKNLIALKNKKKIRKYKAPAVKRQRQIPYWRSIVAINTELRNFAQQNDRVYFFDALPLFVDASSGGKQVQMKGRLITMSGHLTPNGFAVWEDAAAKYASNLMYDLRENEPDLFEATKSSTTNWMWPFAEYPDTDSYDDYEDEFGALGDSSGHEPPPHSDSDSSSTDNSNDLD